MGFNKKSSGAVELIPNAKLTGISGGSAPKDAVNFAQVFTDGNTHAGDNTYSGDNTFSGANTFSGSNTFSASNVYYSLTGQTALAGGAQAGTALSAEYMNFTTVATALDSAQLPVARLPGE